MTNGSRLALLAGLAVAIATGCPAHAGQNLGATARIYWLVSDTSALPTTNSQASTLKALVTIKGLQRFRGADVQLTINPPRGETLPAAWQAEPGGCAAANYAAFPGGFNPGASTIWPNVFNAPPALPNVATFQPGGFFYQYDACLTPHGVALIWFSAAAASAAPRDPAVEYAVFGFTMDVSGAAGTCAGDNSDPSGPVPVCVSPYWRLPCGNGAYGNTMVVVDSAAVKDFCQFSLPQNLLSWHGELRCVCVCTPVAPNTWGRLRRLYQ